MVWILLFAIRESHIVSLWRFCQIWKVISEIAVVIYNLGYRGVMVFLLFPLQPLNKGMVLSFFCWEPPLRPPTTFWTQEEQQKTGHQLRPFLGGSRSTQKTSRPSRFLGLASPTTNPQNPAEKRKAPPKPQNQPQNQPQNEPQTPPQGANPNGGAGIFAGPAAEPRQAQWPAGRPNGALAGGSGGRA